MLRLRYQSRGPRSCRASCRRARPLRCGAGRGSRPARAGTSRSPARPGLLAEDDGRGARRCAACRSRRSPWRCATSGAGRPVRGSSRWWRVGAAAGSSAGRGCSRWSGHRGRRRTTATGGLLGAVSDGDGRGWRPGRRCARSPRTLMIAEPRQVLVAAPCRPGRRPTPCRWPRGPARCRRDPQKHLRGRCGCPASGPGWRRCLGHALLVLAGDQHRKSRS